MSLQQKTEARKSLPLTARDLRDLSLLSGSSVHRTALFALADLEVLGTQNVSEAQLLHTLFEVGLRAVAERVEEESYAAEAAARGAEDAARRRSARRPRPERAEES